MKQGVLIFAHNSNDLDYVSLAIIAGSLAKKYLKVPVSLVTDSDTLGYIISSNIKEKTFDVFDKIIKIQEKPTTKNTRILHDGSSKIIVPFINHSRPNAYDLTPYDRTLLIDSDFLIFSNSLGNYWDCDSDVMISKEFKNIRNEPIRILDYRISETGPLLRWATTLMFSKTKEAKIFFDLVSHIRDHYKFYSNLYKFDSTIYRNDIAFSLAKHILDNFSNDDSNYLPPVLSLIDRDSLEIVKTDGRLIFSISNDRDPTKITLTSVKGSDIHIMNKNSIIRNYENLLSLT